MNNNERVILKAAASILREEGLQRVVKADSHDERLCANEALRASVDIETFLSAVDDLERPF